MRSTKFLLIGTKQQLEKINPSSTTAADALVEAESDVRNLGSWFDSRLNMSFPIKKRCISAFYHLHYIGRTRKFLTLATTKALVHAFVASRVDYCNSLLYYLPAIQISKVQRVLNAALRLVSCAARYCHVTTFLHELHWLPVRQQINYKICFLRSRQSTGRRQFICKS